MWLAKLRAASVRYICPVAYSVRWSGQICCRNATSPGRGDRQGYP
jgi:hypothetical protein